jgi:hypothetical protein
MRLNVGYLERLNERKEKNTMVTSSINEEKTQKIFKNKKTSFETMLRVLRP